MSAIRKRTIREHCETGKIPACKLAGRWRIMRDKFAATLEESSNILEASEN
jgi:hypothetical protein